MKQFPKDFPKDIAELIRKDKDFVVKKLDSNSYSVYIFSSNGNIIYRTNLKDLSEILSIWLKYKLQIKL